MLDVRSNCSILLRSYMTQRFVLRGSSPAQVLCGFKAVYIVGVAARPSEARGHAGPARSRGSHARRTRPLRRLAGPFQQKAMWPSHCVARVHAGPRGS